MDEKRLKRTTDYLWQIIVLILGAVSLVASFVVPDEKKLFTTLNGVGVSLILSGSLGVFVNIIFNRKDAKYEVCEKWKIENIYLSRAIANLEMDALQQSAKNQIDIIAFGLSSWRQSQEKTIDDALQRGVKIRILTMHPDNEMLSFRDRAEGKPEGSTKESITHLDEFFKMTKKRKSVQIKYHMDLPLDFYFRIDDHIFVGPYLFGRESQQMITYEYSKGGTGFDYYKDYFESLWNEKTIPKLTYQTLDSGNG